MTTLYKPVLIESADLPMDKFPEGTIATHPDHWPVERCSCSRWESEGPDRYDPDMVGFTALVPIEAEEEARGITTWPRPDNAPWPERSDLYSNSAGEHYYRDEDGVAHDITEEMTAWLAAQPVHTRYVTPWEET